MPYRCAAFGVLVVVSAVFAAEPGVRRQEWEKITPAPGSNTGCGKGDDYSFWFRPPAEGVKKVWYFPESFPESFANYFATAHLPHLPHAHCYSESSVVGRLTYRSVSY
jgi:hypothetical protein